MNMFFSLIVFFCFELRPRKVTKKKKVVLKKKKNWMILETKTFLKQTYLVVLTQFYHDPLVGVDDKFSYDFMKTYFFDMKL